MSEGKHLCTLGATGFPFGELAAHIVCQAVFVFYFTCYLRLLYSKELVLVTRYRYFPICLLT